MLIESGEVLVWGQGGSGQLGTKANKVEDVPTGPKNSIKAISIAAGKNYSLIISPDLRVYFSGKMSNETDGTKEFKKLDSLTNIKLVSAGISHAGAVNGNGEIFLWGNNKDAQVSSKKTANVPKPVRVSGLNAVSVKQISCGEGFTLARTADGRLYSWGRGKYGVLGHGDELPKNTPTLVPSLPFTDIVHLDAGHSFAVAVSQEGELFTFGKNCDGQLGHNHTKHVLTPTPVDKLAAHHVIKASCSKGEKGCFMVILLDNGSVYTVGNGSLGRLGLGDSKNRLVPEKIGQSFFGKEKVKSIATGGTMSHAVTVSGAVYVWGSGANGETGLVEARRIRNYATDRPKKLETLPKGRPVTMITSSVDHSLAIVENQ